MKLRNLTAAGVLGALLLPAVADAATKPVFRGPPPKGQLKGVKGPVVDADFYPRRITIAAGDKIKLTTVAFGDTIFFPKGTPVQGLAVEGAEPIAGAKDAAGADMYFNGLKPFAPNPLLVAPAGKDKKITGKKIVNNPVSLSGPSKPWTVAFPKRGTYTLRSLVHPGLKLTVVVKKKGAKVPTAKQDARRVAKQLKATVKLAKKLVAAPGPSGNVVQAGSDDKGVATIAFFPAKKTVDVGDTVTFTMPKRSIESHNVAFGPKDYLDKHAQAFFGPVFEPFVTFRSEAPGTPIVFDGANHGNGWVNTGLLDSDSKSPAPKADQITFTKAGTYSYYCAVHGNDMAGEITVQ